MMKRNGIDVEMCWMLLNANHPLYVTLTAALQSAHQALGPSFSINLRPDGTQALVKLLGPMPSLDPAWLPCILRVYTELDHAEARVLVNTSATLLDPSAGWQRPENSL